jgi:hypothetical protein
MVAQCSPRRKFIDVHEIINEIAEETPQNY